MMNTDAEIESSGDVKIDWMISKVATCFKMNKNKWKEFLTNEDNKYVYSHITRFTLTNAYIEKCSKSLSTQRMRCMSSLLNLSPKMN
jgi:hypothetical protein